MVASVPANVRKTLTASLVQAKIGLLRLKVYSAIRSEATINERIVSQTHFLF